MCARTKTKSPLENKAIQRNKTGVFLSLTRKTVCGTQTRQDGSLNKYQPDSPKGQKTGIGMAAISPVPLRETIRKRKPVPGSDTDKGKAIAMDKYRRA